LHRRLQRWWGSTAFRFWRCEESCNAGVGLTALCQ
jgi:hypothetical protein